MQGVGFLLLAGGQSRRMGGGDKNQLNLGGKSVLHHILDRVDRAGAPRSMLMETPGFEAYGLPVIADVVDGYVGPLAGILTGLEWIATYHPTCTHMISLATDAPFLPPDLAHRLYARLGRDAIIVQAQSMGNATQYLPFGQWLWQQI